MLIADILPEARKLPRQERFRLAQMLLEELATEEISGLFEDGQVFAIHTPSYAPEAASELARVLAKDGVQ